MRLPSGETRTQETPLRCPLSGAPWIWPAGRSHRTSDPSEQPPIKVLPSGVTATLLALTLFSTSGGLTWAPVATFQTNTVLAKSAETSS